MFGSPLEHASDVSDGSPDMSPLAFFAEPSASVSPPPQQEASPAEDPATKPVSKKRARDSSDDDDVFVKPLPVKRSRISSDEEEKLSPEALIKRQRNTEAARRSRQRKVEKMEGLQDQVRDLENDRNKLKLRVAVLENERSSWNAREKELLSRVSHLEQQLAESHRAMLAFGIRG
ncbi:hypothetical protein HK102_012866 [Quaeritorhiza haematococci]|nr:hypothetical protein HK102_012866 [Quaeritorhiza haematococci]